MDLNCETMKDFPTLPPIRDDRHCDLDGAGQLYHRRGFTEIMQKIYHCRAEYINHDGNAILIYKRLHPLACKGYITSPLNIAPAVMGKGDWPVMLSHLRGFADQNNMPLHLTTTSDAAIPADFQTIQPNLLSVLTLPDTLEGRFPLYKQRQRSKVRSAIKNNADHVTLKWGDAHELKQWFTILQNLYRHKHRMITQPFSLYHHLHDKGYGHLLIAKCNHSRHILGGLFMLCDTHEWEYGWGAVSPQGQKQSIMNLLMDQAIQSAILAGAKSFNFGASPNSDSDLRFFKTRWGAQEIPLTHIFYNQQAHITDLNESYKTIRALIPYVPNPVLGLASRLAVPFLI